MKLYIPTCTLNFNNILSSESISPLGFYSRREFGNKRFYPVCANNYEQAILLYSKYPSFKIEESKIENSPMVIEINTDDYRQDCFEKVGERKGVEIYACYQTIYLNPFHCRIYFINQFEILSALAKAEQSLENKLYNFYSANCKTDANEEKFVWTPAYSKVKLGESLMDTTSDAMFDRVKGFLYCYLIGANNPVSEEVAKLKALSRKLSNVLSAVVHSPNHRPSDEQKRELLEGIVEFNRIYSSADENSEHNLAIEKAASETIDACLQHIRGLYEKYYSDAPLKVEKYCDSLQKEFYRYLHKSLPFKEGFNAETLWACVGSDSPDLFDRVTASMEEAVRKLENRHIGKSEKCRIDEMAQIQDGVSVHITDGKRKYGFYEELINSQIRGDYKKIMAERNVDVATAQAYNGGTLLKRMMGGKWENSPASKYVNGLLGHFQNSVAFDLFAIGNPILEAFAAFCQKGDDIDRLSDYLVQCGFREYELAYGIYGATHGFATLPKTFTSVLIDGDSNYYQEVSKTIWRMLCGVELKDTELPQAERTTDWDAPVEEKIDEGDNGLKMFEETLELM